MSLAEAWPEIVERRSPVVQELRTRSGSRAGAPGRAERGAAGGDQGWAALRPAELAVIRVVVCGCTNREAAALLFLPRTRSAPTSGTRT